MTGTGGAGAAPERTPAPPTREEAERAASLRAAFVHDHLAPVPTTTGARS